MEITKGKVIYYARIMPTIPLFEVCDLRVRTVTDTWFVAVEDKTKHAFYFNNSDIDKMIFDNRLTCLNIVVEAESHCKKKSSTETYYEEY